MQTTTKIEAQRQIIQRNLDAQKTKEQRNILGQFSTPITFANDILQYAAKIMPKHEKIRFLDPAIGTGAFFSALNNVIPSTHIEAATGYEVDEHYGNPSRELWSKSILNYQLADFTKVTPPVNENQKFNLIICNPPYVRHHYINGQKERLQLEALNAANMKLSGLSGLYCYFMALSHRWMTSEGIAGWLIPSEFMDVNYGQAVKNYLLNEVSLLQIHRFDPKDVQFDDALVSSAIVWFQKKKPDANHKIKFTYGGTINHPSHEKEVTTEVLANEKKWTRFPLNNERGISTIPRLSDFFLVKRGIATGDNKYFILTKSSIEEKRFPLSQFKPILPSPRYLSETEVKTDNLGYPLIENKLFVLDCKLQLNEVERLYPELYEYIQEGVKSGVSDRYLCKNRKIWYAQENRIESPFYCTYIGRSDKEGKKPFRFILNHSKAIVANSYLILYPKPELMAVIAHYPEMTEIFFEALNNTTERAMLDEGRVYGGGMHKLEPSELANIPAPEILRLIKGANHKYHLAC
ncbi:MAG: Eco57I restriction-modification methylase domain-containing protein [Methylococcales bacterium]|nr:Eco57I restriction-modification methylase domain-containing protein [Methylococcales bacterium]MDP3838001.1 Eco57I restriction-modification methylase domain-containing protein [Methylococcales bacterium]